MATTHLPRIIVWKHMKYSLWGHHSLGLKVTIQQVAKYSIHFVVLYTQGTTIEHLMKLWLLLHLSTDLVLKSEICRHKFLYLFLLHSFSFIIYSISVFLLQNIINYIFLGPWLHELVQTFVVCFSFSFDYPLYLR